VSGEPDPTLKTRFFLLMVYAALFGALSSLLAVANITLYNQGVNFFSQVNLIVFNINIWPLVLLTGAGILIGLLIKFFGQHEGLEFPSASTPRRAASITETCPLSCFKLS
jgi:hypothetical protein